MSSNSTVPAQFEQWPMVNLFMSVLFSFHLAVFAFQIPFSLLNIGILCRTSLLHRNLKFVLLVQSVLFTVFALARGTQIFIIFINQTEDNYFFGYKILLFLVDCPHLILTYIGHVLFFERILATFLFRNYENSKNPLFSLIWFIILTTYSVIMTAEQSFKDKPQVEITADILIAFYAALAISFFEIFAFSVISTLNLKRFSTKLQKQKRVHSLSERYQLAENIRTGRQLWPTFLLHFLNICAVTITSVLGFYQIITDPELLKTIWEIYFFLLTINNFIIEYTTISRHPLLRRDSLYILSNLFNTFSMPIPFVRRVGDYTQRQNIGRIDGKIVQEKQMNEMDNYFKMLTKQWGRSSKK